VRGLFFAADLFRLFFFLGHGLLMAPVPQTNNAFFFWGNIVVVSLQVDPLQRLLYERVIPAGSNT